jgi:hypothetical protein
MSYCVCISTCQKLRAEEKMELFFEQDIFQSLRPKYWWIHGINAMSWKNKGLTNVYWHRCYSDLLGSIVGALLEPAFKTRKEQNEQGSSQKISTPRFALTGT